MNLRDATAQDAGAISALITRTLRISNAQDYPADVIAAVAHNFRPEAVAALIARRHVRVAETSQLIATASLDGDWLRAVFVCPDHQGKGIGQQIVADIESLARQAGHAMLWVPSSLTALGFYRRLGFVQDHEEGHGPDREVIFRKSL